MLRDFIIPYAGTTQPSPQRVGRVERRNQQLRAKQRTRPEIPAAEATRARSTSCAASSAFIPEGEQVAKGQTRNNN